MNRPCDSCLASSWLLARLGGHVEVLTARRRPKRLLALEQDELLSAIGGRERQRIGQELSRFDPARALGKIERAGLSAACSHSGAFPWPVAFSDDPEPPWVLHCLGDPAALDDARRKGSVAIVGARRADGYGRATARMLAREVAARGGAVISGMAIGIDTEAHRGALEVERGLTIAVLAGGLDRPYPARNRGLCSEIAANGCVVSEMPPGCGVWKWSFPARNRLVAALADVVTVVQATTGSGSLHTAEAALLRGRTVAAVPGRIDSPLNEGSNRLMADGAVPITDAAALGDAAGLLRPGRRAAIPEDLVGTLEAVAEGKLEERLAASHDGGSRMLADLTRLELIGAVRRERGGGWVTSS